MHSKFKIIFLSSLLYLLTSLTGCNQPPQQDPIAGSPDMIRRAQLVGQENLQLKKQIETLKVEIADLKGRLEAEQARYEEFTELQAETHRGLMRIIMETQAKLRLYEQEIEN